MKKERESAMKKRVWIALVLLAALLLPVMVMADEIEYVTFGHYEQDNDLTNGKEPIEWRVLKEEGGEVMLITRYALDAKPYNETAGYRIHWPECTLRAWLNETFYAEAFDEEEQAAVILKTLKNWKEVDTQDRVFLLDNDEAKGLFANHVDRQTVPTAYAIAQGAYRSTKYGPGNAQWWLRTHSWESNRRAAYVAASGGVMTCGGNSVGVVENAKWAVRPVICIRAEDLERLRGE